MLTISVAETCGGSLENVDWGVGEADGALTGVDLFCGIGGFHVASQLNEIEIVFACDIDDAACAAYEHNFGLVPDGDIAQVKHKVPEHDVLMAGFPCQPYSVIGKRGGLHDPRGSLIFDVADIAAERLPRAFVLENVKQFSTHDKGRTLERVVGTFEELGYKVDSKILNALDFGLPQKRERTIVVGLLDGFDGFAWPTGCDRYAPLDEVLEDDVDPRYLASDAIQARRLERHTAQETPAIWHENKGGNVSSHPFSCALRAGASYNYLLVDGVRRLTEREMLRLQGFPEWYELPGSYQQARSQTGNSVAVPVVSAVLRAIRRVLVKSS